MSAAPAVLDSTRQKLIDELTAEKAPPIYNLCPEDAHNAAARAIRTVEKPAAHIKDHNVNTTAGPLPLRKHPPPSGFVLVRHSESVGQIGTE
jgi:hypothetical protein